MSTISNTVHRFGSGLCAIVPACGRATRLAPYPCPKELFPIGWQEIDLGGRVERRPKVAGQYLVEALQLAAPEAIYMVVGQGKQDLCAYFTPPQFADNIAFIYRESTPSMVHTIDAAYNWTRSATVLFGMPDTIVTPADAFVRLAAEHRQRGADLTLGAFYTDEPHRFGMIEIARDGRVVAQVDKPAQTSLRTMWGIAAWESGFTEIAHELVQDPPARGREVVLGDAIDRALARGLAVNAVVFEDGAYLDVGTAAGIERALERVGAAAR